MEPLTILVFHPTPFMSLLPFEILHVSTRSNSLLDTFTTPRQTMFPTGRHFTRLDLFFAGRMLSYREEAWRSHGNQHHSYPCHGAKTDTNCPFFPERSNGNLIF